MTDAATTAHGRGGASFVDGVGARHLVGQPIESYQLAREFLWDNRFSRADPFRGPTPHNERTPT
ncbi:hypothetical protein [Amycolatopsis sp. NBC_01480]|uniref:hypothetical protein n=1 Tax=Amycolatopsis sp. NBC_01480 TaxID=2903562 RepID=UPI002E2D199F|nr:hypothetical protein [Amycolatopsis sp. NBC_01480]